MKSTFLFLTILFLGLKCGAQNFQLQIIGNSNLETKTIDSLKYLSTHSSLQSLNDETSKVIKQLTAIGYLNTQIAEIITDKSKTALTKKLNLGVQTKFLHIYIGKQYELKKLLNWETDQDTIVIPYFDSEDFLKKTIDKLEKSGYPLVKINLKNTTARGKILYTEIDFTSDKKRIINSIKIISSSDNSTFLIPSGQLKQIKKKFIGKNATAETVSRIKRDIEALPYLKQVKFPELLFSRDSTITYVYLESKKSNTFDGFLGFTNTTTNKLKLNGYLNLNLQNILNKSEQISIYWKNDGNQQKTFNALIDVPYLFSSSIGMSGQMNLFTQDSTFQNATSEFRINYNTTQSSQFSAGYKSTNSDQLKNTVNKSIADFKSTFLTLKYNLINSIVDDEESLTDLLITIKAGLGSRKQQIETNNTNATTQHYIDIAGIKNIKLDKKNLINLKTEIYYLNSKDYLANELMRFGGQNSIRGFAENSLQAHFLTSILTEYRHKTTQNLYLHTIFDFAIFRDNSVIKINSQSEKIFSLGLGAGIYTKNGLITLTAANGQRTNANFNFSNTIATICYNVKF